jgi:O-antigen/teichoic acid export membrane protein
VDRYNLLNVGSQIVLLAALVVVLLVNKGGAVEAVLAFGGSILVLVVIGWFWIRRRRVEEDPLRLDRGFAKTSLSYGLRGYGTTVFGQLNYRFDQVLVTQFAGITEQGYYSIAVLLAEKLAHITNSIQLVLFPKVSASTPEEANTITATACRHAIYWVGLAAIAMFLLRRPLVSVLYGSAFLPALAPLGWLIPGIFLLSFWKVLAVDLSGRNIRFPTTMASGIAFAINTALNLWWIPRYGILGAAWSSTICYALQSLILVITFVRITGVPAHKLVVPERRDLEIYRRIWRQVRRAAPA